MQSITLSQGWEFKQVPSKGFDNVDGNWTACSKVPTSVHVELLKQGKIPDPFKGLNEWQVQWVQEAEWDFRTTFDAAELGEHEHADVVFEGLDTYCDVHLVSDDTHTSLD